MGVLFFGAIWVKQNVLPTLLLYAILLTYFEFLVVSALTFAVSCTSSSAVLPTISGLFIYIVGNLTEYLKGVYERAEMVAEAGIIDSAVSMIAKLLYYVLPNLQNFSLRQQIVHLQPNDPPTDVQIPALIAYALLYAVAGFGIALMVFRKKEL